MGKIGFWVRKFFFLIMYVVMITTHVKEFGETVRATGAELLVSETSKNGTHTKKHVKIDSVVVQYNSARNKSRNAIKIKMTPMEKNRSMVERLTSRTFQPKTNQLTTQPHRIDFYI